MSVAVAIAFLLYPSLVLTSRVVSAFGGSAYNARVASARHETLLQMKDARVLALSPASLSNDAWCGAFVTRSATWTLRTSVVGPDLEKERIVCFDTLGRRDLAVAEAERYAQAAPTGVPDVRLPFAVRASRDRAYVELIATATLAGKPHLAAALAAASAAGATTARARSPRTSS